MSFLLSLLLACAPTEGALAPSPDAPAARVGDPGRVAITTLLPPPALPFRWARSVAVGDFNGDGAPELAVSGKTSEFAGGTVILYRYENGALVQSQPINASPTVPGAPAGFVTNGGDGESMAAGDFNGDGFDDLLLLDTDASGTAPGFDPAYPYGRSWAARMVLRLGSSNGLGAASAAAYFANYRPRGLRVVRDPAGDGRDQAVYTASGTVTHTRGVSYAARISLVGGALVETLLNFEGNDNYYAVSPSIDVDVDGREEAVFTVGYLAGISLSRSAQGWADILSWDGTLNQSFEQVFTVPTAPHLPIDILGVEDVDLDGLPDLVLQPTGEDRRAHVLGGLGGGSFGPAVAYLDVEPSDVPIGGALPPSDFDGDGVVDLLALTRDGGWNRLYVWSAAQGGPDPQPSEVIDLTSTAGTPFITTTDLDGDGDADIVMARLGVSVEVAWGGGATACAGGAPPDRVYLDDDNDGFASSAHAQLRCDAPPGSQPTPGTDCDDDDPMVFPGSTSVARTVDNDCDGWVTCYLDGDGDRFPSTDTATVPGFACDAGGRRLYGAERGFDCNDADALTYPRAVEQPWEQGVDRNCDGLVSCYPDVDGDGRGVSPAAQMPVGPLGGCPAGGARITGDCAPTDPLYFRIESWYPDQDADGVAGASARSCLPPPGGTLVAPAQIDCDDANPAVSPNTAELTGGGDENCDALFACWRDDDGDGWGTSDVVEVATPCGAGAAADVSGDCDDAAADAFPGSAAQRLGADADCDGLVSCYADADLDGQGAAAWIEAPTCATAGAALTDVDCDDGDANVRVGVPERAATPYDDNCNGTTSLSVSLGADALWVQDAPPANRIGVAFSPRTAPDAACPYFLGGACFDLIAPRLLGPVTTDAAGAATLPMGPVPAGASGWAQVFAGRGFVGPLTPIAAP